MVTNVDPQLICQAQIFHGLEFVHLQQVTRYLKLETYPARVNFINVGLPDDTVFFILRGTVKIHIQHPDGKDVILAILKSGDIVGELNVVDHEVRSATAITREESTLVWMERSAFEHCLETIPKLAINLVQVLGRRLRLANAQIRSLSVQDVFGRVARQILAFAQEYGETLETGDQKISLQLTQSEIAGLVGATRKSVNEVISFYKESGYIAEKSRYYIIHNKDALARRCK